MMKSPEPPKADALPSLPDSVFLILSGETGTGKTELVNEIESIIDLYDWIFCIDSERKLIPRLRSNGTLEKYSSKIKILILPPADPKLTHAASPGTLSEIMQNLYDDFILEMFKLPGKKVLIVDQMTNISTWVNQIHSEKGEKAPDGGLKEWGKRNIHWDFLLTRLYPQKIDLIITVQRRYDVIKKIATPRVYAGFLEAAHFHYLTVVYKEKFYLYVIKDTLRDRHHTLQFKWLNADLSLKQLIEIVRTGVSPRPFIECPIPKPTT